MHIPCEINTVVCGSCNVFDRETLSHWQLCHRCARVLDVVAAFMVSNSPMSQWFPPNGEQPEQRKSAHTLYQQTDSCRAIFHKYCCHTEHGGIVTNLFYEVYWWILFLCQNTIMRVYGAWVKRCIAFYVQKHIAARVVLSKLPAGSRQASRRFCTGTFTVGQRKKVAAVTFFRCPIVTLEGSSK